MKFSFSNFSSAFLNYFWDVSKNVILAIYFFVDALVLFFFFFLSYLENLVFSFLFRARQTSYFADSLSFTAFFLNSRYSQVSSFYLGFLNYLNIGNFAKMTSDVLILVAFYSFFSVYFFTGYASVAFSNEGLWLSVLSLAVIYFFYYLRSLDAAGKDVISLEIENLKKLMQKNSELSAEVASLEDSSISFQFQVVSILELWFITLSQVVDQLDSNVAFYDAQIDSLIDSVFVEHLKDVSILTLSRENFSKVTALKDYNEELISDLFETN